MPKIPSRKSEQWGDFKSNPGTKKCDYCFEEIAAAATRCKHCSGQFHPCKKCKRHVGVETKSQFVGLLRGGQKEVRKCLHCKKRVGGSWL